MTGWLMQMMRILAEPPADSSAQQIGQRLHNALQVAEAEKYATKESRFSFCMSGATPDDIAQIRACLTPFENSIVEIEINKGDL